MQPYFFGARTAIIYAVFSKVWIMRAIVFIQGSYAKL